MTDCTLSTCFTVVLEADGGVGGGLTRAGLADLFLPLSLQALVALDNFLVMQVLI